MLWKSGEETTSSAWAGGDSRWARGDEGSHQRGAAMGKSVLSIGS